MADAKVVRAYLLERFGIESQQDLDRALGQMKPIPIGLMTRKEIPDDKNDRGGKSRR